MDSNKICLAACKDQAYRLETQFRHAGFDGYFHTNGGFAGRLADSLTQWVASYLEGHEYGREFPVTISTYSDWRGGDCERTQCHFHVDYENDIGFEVKRIEVNRLSRYSDLIRKEIIPLKRGEELPSSQKLNQRVSENEFCRSHKAKKRIRF